MSSKAVAARLRHGAVQGNLAYDLSNPDLYPEYTYGTPLDIPAAREIDEEVVSASHAASAQAVSPVAIIGYAITAVLLIFSLMARIQLTAAANDCVALENSLSELKTEQSKLQISYESAFNMTEIEDYAINTLGMQKPRSDQIYYVSGSVGDKAVVLGESTETIGFVDQVGDFLSSIAAYLGLSDK